jgi:hypothetical protein
MFALERLPLKNGNHIQKFRSKSGHSWMYQVKDSNGTVLSESWIYDRADDMNEAIRDNYPEVIS